MLYLEIINDNKQKKNTYARDFNDAITVEFYLFNLFELI